MVIKAGVQRDRGTYAQRNEQHNTHLVTTQHTPSDNDVSLRMARDCSLTTARPSDASLAEARTTSRPMLVDSDASDMLARENSINTLLAMEDSIRTARDCSDTNACDSMELALISCEQLEEDYKTGAQFNGTCSSDRQF